MLLPKRCPVCKHEPLSIELEYAVCDHCHAYRKRLYFWQRPLAWTEYKSWWWRALLLAWFAFLLVQNLQQSDFALNRTSNIISAFNLGIHELGHLLFTPLGGFMTILGGSLFQCLFPLLWLGAFIWKRWYFAAALCLCWFGLNLFDVAAYAADAQARLLSPATLSADYDQAHDWDQLLTRLDMLDSEATIASGLRVAGTVAISIGLLGGGLLVMYMFRHWLNRYHQGHV